MRPLLFLVDRNPVASQRLVSPAEDSDPMQAFVRAGRSSDSVATVRLA